MPKALIILFREVHFRSFTHSKKLYGLLPFDLPELSTFHVYGLCTVHIIFQSVVCLFTLLIGYLFVKQKSSLFVCLSIYCGIGAWSHGFALAREVLYCLSHTSNPEVLLLMKPSLSSFGLWFELFVFYLGKFCQPEDHEDTMLFLRNFIHYF
jgi:hypothetical protein